MGSSRERSPDPGGPSAAGSASRPLPAAADDTVISGQPPAGPLSMAEIGRVLEGRRLGAYRLERFVGGGGMGAVFRAVDTTLHRVVAVKVLSRQQSADEEMLKRFRNEAQSAARLDHENIGRVHAVGSEDGWHFIVFEYIEGTNLRDLVRERGQFDAGRALNLAIQMADALDHAADRDVVHRDIKPSNIIITPAGRARLVDMGLARLHHVEAQEDLTTSGMTLGTFDYISPEQARDPRSADVRSDLYSLGCTLFFALVGRPPFAEGTMVQKLLLHQQEPPPSIEPLRPDVPRRFADAVARLMAKDPADRYQRPADLIADLLAVAEEEGLDVSSSRSTTVDAVEATSPALEPGSSWLPWFLPVVGLAATVAALWWNSPSARSTVAPLRPAAVEESQDRGLAAATVAPGPWRVVDVPGGERETSSLAEALRRAGNRDVIELDYDGVRDEPALVTGGIDVMIRGAAGRDPTVRFFGAVTEGGPGASPSASWSISGGTVTIERVRMVLVANGFTAVTALFGLGDAATLVCEDARLEMRAGDDVADETAAVRTALVSAEGAIDAAMRGEIRIARSTVDGLGGLLRVSGERHVDVIWSGGRCAVTGPFLIAEGGAEADRPGPVLSLSLADALFACKGGFARLLDSPARSASPSLRVFAEACRFAVPDGEALLEQSGVGEPDRYQGLVEWLDAGSRYEGSAVFRRIDGSAERVEIEYSAANPPLTHDRLIDSDVEGWWSGGPNS